MTLFLVVLFLSSENRQSNASATIIRMMSNVPMITVKNIAKGIALVLMIAVQNVSILEKITSNLMKYLV